MLLVTDTVEKDLEMMENYQEEYMKQYHDELARYDDWIEMMGDEFKDLPLYTKEEVERLIEGRKERIEALGRMKAPKVVIDNEKNELLNYQGMLVNEKYAKTDEEFKYIIDYHMKEDEVNEILYKAYNIEDDE